MSVRTVVVTGGAGFIGSNLVHDLLVQGFAVRVIDSYIAGKRPDRMHDSATYHEVDIRDEEKLLPLLKGAEIVFHAAALPRVQYTIENPGETFSANVMGTVALLDAARKSGVKRVVFSSSAATYGDEQHMPLTESMRPAPMSPYALHKEVGENLCRLYSLLYGLETVSLRYFNVYGPGFDAEGAYGLVVGKFLTQRAAGEPLTIAGDGSHTRDYVHVSDVVRANLLAAESANVGKGEVINIGTGVEISVKKLAQSIGGETTSIEPRLEPARACADIALAKKLLAWEPQISFADGIIALKKEFGV